MQILTSKIFLICALVFYLLIYVFLNKMIKRGHQLLCSFDDQLPFIPIFVVPYAFYFVLLIGFLFYLCLLPLLMVQHVVLTFFIMLTVSYVFFLLYPTYIEPFVTPQKDFFSQIVNFIYKHDKRFNAFPSLHVAISTLILLFVLGWNLWLGIILFPFVLAIHASTVLIKQHYLPDIPAGIIIAILAYMFSTVILST